LVIRRLEKILGWTIQAPKKGGREKEKSEDMITVRQVRRRL